MFNGIETLFEHIPQCMFFVKDRDGRFLAVNEAMARVLVHQVVMLLSASLTQTSCRRISQKATAETISRFFKRASRCAIALSW